MINHSCHEEIYNVKLFKTTRNIEDERIPYLLMVSRMDIMPGQELFLSYSADYAKNTKCCSCISCIQSQFQHRVKPREVLVREVQSRLIPRTDVTHSNDNLSQFFNQYKPR